VALSQNGLVPARRVQDALIDPQRRRRVNNQEDDNQVDPPFQVDA